MKIPFWLSAVAVAVPPLVLAGVGMTHPTDLTAQSAEYWRNLHIGILPVFPLLGFAPWLLARASGARRGVLWPVGVLGFLYAAFYTALDVLAGIGAGGLRLDDMGMAVGTLYGLGDSLGLIGSIALVAAAIVASITVFRRAGVGALPGALFVIIGSLLFLDDHIFFPVGVVGQLMLAIGWIALLVALHRSAPTADPSAAPSADSRGATVA